MELRRGRASDAAALAEIEAACFPAAEAAAAEEIAARLKVYANHFYVLWDGARPVAFIDGMNRICGMKCMPMHRCTMRREPGR